MQPNEHKPICYKKYVWHIKTVKNEHKLENWVRFIHIKRFLWYRHGTRKMYINSLLMVIVFWKCYEWNLTFHSIEGTKTNVDDNDTSDMSMKRVFHRYSHSLSLSLCVFVLSIKKKFNHIFSRIKSESTFCSLMRLYLMQCVAT